MARSPIQNLALLFGSIFLAIGVLGFVPGITQEYGRLDVYDEPGAELLGIFAVNWIHNLAHIGFGVAGFVLASTALRARRFFLVGGAIYLALWVYGIVIGIRSSANLIALNTADNWLHLILGVTMVAIGLMFASDRVARAQTPMRTRRAA